MSLDTENPQFGSYLTNLTVKVFQDIIKNTYFAKQ